MIESASNTSRRRRQVWLARMRQRDACWVGEVSLTGSLIEWQSSPCDSDSIMAQITFAGDLHQTHAEDWVAWKSTQSKRPGPDQKHNRLCQLYTQRFSNHHVCPEKPFLKFNRTDGCLTIFIRYDTYDTGSFHERMVSWGTPMMLMEIHLA